jgi:hypothetical protein
MKHVLGPWNVENYKSIYKRYTEFSLSVTKSHFGDDAKTLRLGLKGRTLQSFYTEISTTFMFLNS